MRPLLSLVLAFFLALPAAAHSYKTGNVMIGHVWAAPTAGNATEVYVSLLNRAPQADQLVSVLAPTAQADSDDGSEYPKVGRNDPCPCGSGRKFKKCHGA